MRASLALYRKACQYYLDNVSLMDKNLYDLCKNYPSHTDRRAIHAKLWLIGRTYTTGIERNVKKTGRQGSALKRVAQLLYDRGSNIDEMFSRLKYIQEPLDPGKLETIVQTHGQFVVLLTPALRVKQTPRSFAAKYMHFHCKAVPIYDSLAATGLRRWRWNADDVIFHVPHDADEVYYKFVLRFWRVYQELRQLNSRVTVRLLDRYLLELADQRKARQNG